MICMDVFYKTGLLYTIHRAANIIYFLLLTWLLQILIFYLAEILRISQDHYKCIIVIENLVQHLCLDYTLCKVQTMVPSLTSLPTLNMLDLFLKAQAYLGRFTELSLVESSESPSGSFVLLVLWI